MTAPRIPRERMSPQHYKAARAEGYSDEEIEADGFEIPSLQERLADSRQSPGQRLASKGVQDAPSLAKRALGAVGKAATLSAGSVPVAGPLALKAAGLEDNAQRYRKEFKDATGIPTAPLEIAQGIASGNLAMSALAKLNAGNKAVQAAKVAVGGSQNNKAGIANAAKRLGVNVGSGAATGAATAEEGHRGEGALIGAAAGTLPSIIEGAGSLVNHAKTRLRTNGVFGKGGKPAAYRANKQMREMLETEGVIPPKASGSAISKPLMTRGADAPEGSRFVDVAGENPQRLIANAQQTPSLEGTNLRNAMRTRAEGASARTDAAFDAATGVPRSFHTREAITGVKEGARPTTEAAFDAAYGSPEAKMIDRPKLDRLLASKRMTKYVKRARAVLGESGESIPKVREPILRPFELGGVEGTVKEGMSTREVPNLRLGHEVNRELNDAWRRALRKGDASTARRIARSRDLLLRELDDAVPEFAPARLREEMTSRVQDALRLGQKASRGALDSRDVRAMVNEILPDGRKQAILQRELMTPAEIADWETAIRNSFRSALVDGMRQNAKRTGKSALDAAQKMRVSELLDMAVVDRAPLNATATREAAWQRGEIASNVPVSVASAQPDSYGGASPWAIAGIPQGRGTLAAAQEIGAMLRAQSKAMSKDVSRNISRMGGVETGTPEYKRMVAALRQSRMLERVPSNARARELGRKATQAIRSSRLGQTEERQ